MDDAVAVRGTRRACAGCGSNGPFYRKRNAKSGLSHKCKACMNAQHRQWCERNRERKREIARAWNKRNQATCKRNNAAWIARNPNRLRELARIAYQERPEIYGTEKVMRRNAAKLRATVAWANREKISAIYREAKELERKTGIKHHVDHIVPLQSSKVCGLHWEGNLRPVPASVNCSKGNRV